MKPTKIHYKDHIEMNGAGITAITVDGEEITKIDFIESVMEGCPNLAIYDGDLYFGNASAFTYDLMFDYSRDIVNDDDQDAVIEYLRTLPVEFVKEG